MSTLRAVSPSCVLLHPTIAAALQLARAPKSKRSSWRYSISDLSVISPDRAPLQLDDVTRALNEVLRSRQEQNNNYKVPGISSLPNEVLLLIFEDVADSAWYGYQSRELHRLAQVSSSWAQLIKETPTFWNRIDSEKNVHTLLRISKNVPLTIHRYCEPSSHFVVDVGEHSARWKSVTLSGGDIFFATITPYLSKPAPILEYLKLEATEGDVVLPIAGGPHLRTLDLSGIAVPWNFVAVRNLRALKLGYLFKHGPEVLEVLQSCEALEELVLRRIGSTDGTDSSDIHQDALESAQTPINLPNLKRLALYHCSPVILISLFQNLSASNLQALEFEDSGALSAVTLSLLANGDKFPIILSHIAQNSDIRRLEVELQDESLVIVDPSSKFLSFIIHRTTSTSPARLWRQFSKAFLNIPIRSTVSLSLDYMDLEDIEGCFSGHEPSVDVLILSSSVAASLQEFCATLGRPSSSLFPDIREIYLTGVRDEGVAELKAARLRRGGETESPETFKINDSFGVVH